MIRTDITKLKPHEFATPAVKALVGQYLIARAKAETIRAAVDKIVDQILSEMPTYATEDHGGHLILAHRNLYLTDDESFARVMQEADKRERAEGLKPSTMPTEHCPALVAEDLQCKIETRLIDESGKPLGISSRTAGLYLETRQKYIDLVVGMIVSLPNFNPLAA